jgi:predicted Zn-dependent peptidase
MATNRLVEILMRTPGIILLIVALTLSAGTITARNSSGSSARNKEQPGNQLIKFTSYKLANGLRLLLAPDESEPGVAINIVFDVGSRNELRGQTGLANLVEHIVMQNLQSVLGERSSSTDEVNKLFGSSLNQERTSYFASFPASRLDSVLSSVAELMRAPDISQAALNKQRAIIIEERKESDNKPYSAMDDTLLDLSYSNYAYKHSSTGSLSNLNNLTLDSARSFFKTYYAPNNAVIAIVGNFDERKTRKIIETNFKEIPSRSAPPRVDISQARFTFERRRTISDPHASFPFYYTGYLTVPSDHSDWYALNLLADILGQGDTSRLDVALVRKKLALSVPEGVNESRAPGLLRVAAKLPAGGSIETVEAIIDSEIARIQSEGVTEVEMLKARSQERQYSSAQLNSAQGKANFLSRTAVYYDDPKRINTELGRLLAVTKEDVQRVARRYLVKTNRAVVIVRPAALR